MYLEVNLTIMIVFAAILQFIFDLLNPCIQNITILAVIIYYIISGFNIVFNLSEHRTKFGEKEKFSFKKKFKRYFKEETDFDKFWVTTRFYKGNVPKRRENLKESLFIFMKTFGFSLSSNNNEGENKIVLNLIKDDVKNLFLLFWFQRNYYIFAKWTRRMTLYGVGVIFFYIIISILVFFTPLCIKFF